MPASDFPEKLKPYRFHGLDLTIKGKNASCTCPFCDKEGKFDIKVETGQYNCFSCQTKGNIPTFLNWLWEKSYEQTEDYGELCNERRILYPDSLRKWGLCRSVISGDWLVPGYNADGKLCQVYRYTNTGNDRANRRALLATPGYGHGLLGLQLCRSVSKVYLCEGLWDGIILWETLHHYKLEDGEAVSTLNPKEAHISDAAVVATPSCNVFSPEWCKVFSGRSCILMFDNDHPKKNEKTKQEVGLQGYRGMKAVTEKLAKDDSPPDAVYYLQWGTNGYDKSLKSGFDVRDAISSGEQSLEARVSRANDLLSKVRVVPEEWIPGKQHKANGKPGSLKVEYLKCETWLDLVKVCERALFWTEGLDRGMSVILAVIVSTRQDGDPIWFKIVGPPSCGKTSLAEAASMNKEFCFPKDQVRGFHSGFISNDKSATTSLLALAKDKSLITKDGDTLLQIPNRSQVLSEARAIYDKAARVHYRNGVAVDDENINLTWLLFGTESLRALDTSELGERFLDVVVAKETPVDVELRIARRAAYQAFVDLDRPTYLNGDSTTETKDSHALLTMKRMTAGYIEYLCKNSTKLMKGVKQEGNEEAIEMCVNLAHFISYVRARPSDLQNEKAQKELCYRLTKQIVRLAKCLTVVMNKTVMDVGIMRRVKAITMDTCRGRTLDIVEALHAAGRDGLDLPSLIAVTGNEESEEKKLLRFMREIGIVYSGTRSQFTALFDEEVSTVKKRSERTRYRLTEDFSNLYTTILDYNPVTKKVVSKE